jgi:hypothetical protein
MLKSATFDKDEAAELKVVSTSCSDCESTSRRLLEIEGGRSVLAAAAASIDMLYIDARLAASIALPFKVYVEGVEVVFDEIEPSPVAEDIDSGIDENDKCEEVVESFSQDVIAETDTVNIYIEASAKKAFSVRLTEEERTKFVNSCQNCFGYTANQIRCKNKRKSFQGEKVWCYHHKSQELEYRKFCTYRDRPAFCSWWETSI